MMTSMVGTRSASFFSSVVPMWLTHTTTSQCSVLRSVLTVLVAVVTRLRKLAVLSPGTFPKLSGASPGATVSAPTPSSPNMPTLRPLESVLVV